MPISDAPQTQSQRRPPLLEFNDVNTYYGELHVLKGVNYRVGDGEIVCLLGGNASGKSTTMKTILGIVQPKSGVVTYGGTTINDLPTAERVKRGIAPVPEARRLFPRMTVLENLEMGAFTRSDTIEIEADMERVFALFPRIKERLKQLAGTLSGGEQQMVAMGRALMARPKLLCMDEPSMGLSPAFVEQVFDIIQAINKQGTTHLHGRAERQHGALDRRLRLRPADRRGRAARLGPEPARQRDGAAGLSRRDEDLTPLARHCPRPMVPCGRFACAPNSRGLPAMLAAIAREELRLRRNQEICPQSGRADASCRPRPAQCVGSARVRHVLCPSRPEQQSRARARRGWKQSYYASNFCRIRTATFTGA